MSDLKKIINLIEAYDNTERCYKAIEELFKEKIDIDTLTEAQVNIAEVIRDIAGRQDDMEWIFMVLAYDNSAEFRAVRIIQGEQNCELD
jgi:hypothetical protein